MRTVTNVGHYGNAVGITDAASQGIILCQLLRDIPFLRPGEVLDIIPDMAVTHHSSDGKANQYFLRGCNLDHGTDFATSVDGVWLSMPTNAHGQGYSDLKFLIPEFVQQIATIERAITSRRTVIFPRQVRPTSNAGTAWIT